MVKFCDIHPSVVVGEGTQIWSFAYIGENTRIGRNCLIANFVHIDRNIVVGDNCRIQAMVYIPEYTQIGNNVKIYPCVCFANEKYPPGKRREPAIVEDDVVIGIGSIIGSDVRLGRGCVVGAGSLVLKDVEPYTVVYGSPARGLYSRREYEEKRKGWQMHG